MLDVTGPKVKYDEAATVQLIQRMRERYGFVPAAYVREEGGFWEVAGLWRTIDDKHVPAVPIHALIFTNTQRALVWDVINGFREDPEHKLALARASRTRPRLSYDREESYTDDSTEDVKEYTLAYRVTSYGSPGNWEHPGDPPEIESNFLFDSDVGLHLDMMDKQYEDLIDKIETKILENPKNFEVDVSWEDA